MWSSETGAESRRKTKYQSDEAQSHAGLNKNQAITAKVGCYVSKYAPFRISFAPLKLAFFVFLGAVPVFSATCSDQNGDMPDELALAVKMIESGDYVSFVSQIDPNARSPMEEKSKLASDLEQYSSEGFNSCSIVKLSKEEGSLSAFLVFQDQSAVLYAFFLVALLDGKWTFLKAQVSSNFDDVYGFVR